MKNLDFFKKKYQAKRGLRKKRKKPLFTIITAVFNGQKYLQETINSISKQKFKNYEYIVIDGKSKDKTVKIIKKNLSNIDLWVSQNDKGLYDAFNKGINLSSGEFICIVNSDDRITPNALFIIQKYIKKYPKIDFIFGSVKKHWGVLHGFKPEKISYSWGFYSSHSTGFYLRRTSANQIGMYNLKYKFHADYDYFYRMIVKRKMRGIGTKRNEITGIFRRGGFSSRIKFRDSFFEQIKIRYNNNQNILIIFIIIIYKLLNHIKKNFFKFFKM